MSPYVGVFSVVFVAVNIASQAEVSYLHYIFVCHENISSSYVPVNALERKYTSHESHYQEIGSDSHKGSLQVSPLIIFFTFLMIGKRCIELYRMGS